MELTQSFVSLLQEFTCVFTAPTYLTFIALVTGWCLSFRRRYVTELIQASGSTHCGHHSRYHRFFSQAAWLLDDLCCVLARLLVAALTPTGNIELAVDDTLCRKRGLTIYGTGMQHDPLISSPLPSGCIAIDKVLPRARRNLRRTTKPRRSADRRDTAPGPNLLWS